MTVRPPPPPDDPKKPPSSSQGPRGAPGGRVSHRIGHAVDEEHVPEGVHDPKRPPAAEAPAQQKSEIVKKAKPPVGQDEKRGGGGGAGGGGSEGGREDQKPPPEPKPVDPQARRIDQARAKGFQQTPGMSEIVAGKSAPRQGIAYTEMLPGGRERQAPRRTEPLTEDEMRPPAFLSAFEGMKDAYLKVKGRMSAKTKELIEGPALEDMVKMLEELHLNDALVRMNEARLKSALWTKLKDDPGPLLLGLNDKRLAEPWRLFADGWDIWVPDGEGGGVELFWEGEAEDEDGEEIEILQSLMFRNNEITFHAKLGPLEDRITFDGSAFYRLKH